MRILIIAHGHPSLSIGGAEVAAYALFEGLNSAAGNEAFYLARAPSYVERHAQTPLSSLNRKNNEAFYEAGHWDEFWLSNDGLTDLRGHFANYLTFLQPDIIHFHHVIGFGVESIAVARRVLPRTKIVITLHEYLAICNNHGQMIKKDTAKLCFASSPSECNRCFPKISPMKFSIRKEHVLAHLGLSDSFVSPSRFLADRFVSWGLPGQKMNIIENGLNGASVPARPLRKTCRRNRFAYFGQISEFKGLHILLEAICLISEDVWLDASLSVFGGNLQAQPLEFQRMFERLIEAAGKRVRFYGSYAQDELPDLMSEVDWVIVPSIWWENSPVVIQEAFLHRRPLIVSNIGGMAEKVQDGINGLHFRVGSPQSLADKMQRAIVEIDLWELLADQASRPLSSADFASEHLALYTKLCSKRSEESRLVKA